MLRTFIFLALTTLAHAATLTWADNSNNETGFEVERSTDGVNFAPLATTARNATTYVDESGGVYYYRVRAVNSSGASAYSNIASTERPSIGALRVNVGTLRLR